MLQHYCQETYYASLCIRFCLRPKANIVLAPAVEEWGLPTEPWVFVVDANGIVAGRYEGVVTPEELREVLG